MYVGSQRIIYLQHNGGTVDYSNGGYSGIPYIGQPYNSPNQWYFVCNPAGASDTWIYLDKLPLSKKAGSEFLGWTHTYGSTVYTLFDGTGTLIYSGNLYGIGGSSLQYLYAKWRQFSFAITLNKGSGSGGTSVVYNNIDNGGKFSDQANTSSISSVAIPSYAGYKFLGYFSASSGGTKYINADGSFTNAFISFSPSSAKTIYAQWEKISYSISLDDNGGSGGSGTIYYKISGGNVYGTQSCDGNPITSVSVPSKTNNAFVGYFSSTGVGATKYVDGDGSILDALSSATFVADTTIYAMWQSAITVTLSKDGGIGGADNLWFNSDSRMWYDSSLMRDAVTRISPPSKDGNTFLGYFSAASGGTKYINADGSFTSDMPTPTSATTFYAHWLVNALVLKLDGNGGSGSPASIYYKEETGWSSDVLGENPITSIAVPTRAGYTFAGFYNGTTAVIDTTGTILLASISADVTATASWTANSYTLTFDYNGGTEGIESKTVTMGSAVGNLPTTSKDNLPFIGWATDNGVITANTIWSTPRNSTAIATFGGWFGDVRDYFGLASSWLIPESSDSGESKRHVSVSHIGRYEQNVTSDGGVWRNPTVTYRVVGNGVLSVYLGKSYSAEFSGGLMTVSGYMITSVQINTSIGEFPTVTISATANEGVDAINNFHISVPIISRARPQTLVSSIYGGGDLQSYEYSASCDPVVIEENMMPCASDVVNGKIEVSTVSLASANEAEPSPVGGFVLISSNLTCGGTAYKFWNAKFRKDLN